MAPKVTKAAPPARTPAPAPRLFAAYELTEMSMNGFHHFAGELGYRLGARHRTAGFGVGYSRSSLFGVERLSLDISMPIRLYLDPIEETRLGEATVRAHRVVPNTWVFVGYRF